MKHLGPLPFCLALSACSVFAPKVAPPAEEPAIAVAAAVPPPASVASAPLAPVEPAPPAMPAPPALGRAVRAEQILDLPGEYFAVQLVAFRDKADVLAYIARHDLGDPPYGRVLRQGEVWYVLLYGVWPSKAEAEAAVAAMPEDLRQATPWVRRLGDLQAAIRALM